MSFLLASIFVTQLLYAAVPSSIASQHGYSFSQTRYKPRKQCRSATVPKDYTVVSGIGGYKVHTSATVWDEAKKICESEGGNLAVVNSEAESAAIRKIISDAGPYSGTHDPHYTLVGFRYIHDRKDFVTIFDTSLKDAGFYTWSPNEPNNHNNREYCGSVHNTDGLLNDLDCNRAYGYICELNASRLVW